MWQSYDTIHRLPAARSRLCHASIGVSYSSVNCTANLLVVPRNRTILAVFLLLLIPAGRDTVCAQDPEFTLFNLNRSYLNPATVGEDCQRVQLQYRNQWHELAGNYATLFSSYEIQPAWARVQGREFQNFKFGLGGYVLHDRAGMSILNTSKIGLQSSVRGTLSNRVKLSLGLEFGILDKTLDWSRLTFPDMIDPTQGFIYGTSISPNQQGNVKMTDVSAGVELQYRLRKPKDDYSTPWLRCGIAGHHLNEPNESLFEGPSVLPVKWSGYVEATLFLGKNRPTRIHAGSFYRNQGDFQHLLTGFNVGYTANGNTIELGPWYRGMPGFQYRDALILNLSLQRESLGFRYAMDVTSSELDPSGWAHEMGVVFLLSCNGLDRNTADCWECDERYKTHQARGKKERRAFGNNTKRKNKKKGVVRRQGIFRTEKAIRGPSKFWIRLQNIFRGRNGRKLVRYNP